MCSTNQLLFICCILGISLGHGIGVTAGIGTRPDFTPIIMSGGGIGRVIQD